MLEVSDLTLRVDGVAHLAGISAGFRKGELTVLLGRTNAGKTSLMRAIAGLLTPDSGRVALDGQDWSRLAPWQRPVAMVTQQFINYPHMSVLDNVAFPLFRRRVPRHQARAAARAVLERVGLGAMTDRRPGQLSGGQQQRVAIARALAKKSPVILLDEPFVNLDYKLREGLREELLELLRAEQETIVIYASTDPREALQMSDTVMLMAEGGVVQSGPPRAVYESPATTRAAVVVNDPPVNLVAMEIAGDAADIDRIGTVPLAALGRRLTPGRYTLGLRAHELAPGGAIPARITLSEVSGSETVTHLQANGLALVMLERTVAERALGSTIGLSADLAAALVFDADGRLVAPEGPHG